MTAEGLRRQLDRAWEEQRLLYEENERLAGRRRYVDRQIETLQRLRANAAYKSRHKARKESDG